jgi:hypothetical protein
VTATESREFRDADAAEWRTLRRYHAAGLLEPATVDGHHSDALWRNLFPEHFSDSFDANLRAAVVAEPGRPERPATDDTLTIQPLPRARSPYF